MKAVPGYDMDVILENLAENKRMIFKCQTDIRTGCP